VAFSLGRYAIFMKMEKRWAQQKKRKSVGGGARRARAGRALAAPGDIR